MKFLLFLSLIGCSSALLGGLFDKILPTKDQCPIKLYNPQDSSYTGIKLYANAETFHPLLQTLSDYAKRCQVKINVKQGFVQGNAIMQKSIGDNRIPTAFQRGEAIEFELFDRHNNILCNQFCMGKSLRQLKHVPNAKCFLRKISRNQDLERDHNKPTIIMKRTQSNIKFNDKQKDLQNKCKKLEMNGKIF